MWITVYNVRQDHLRFLHFRAFFRSLLPIKSAEHYEPFGFDCKWAGIERASITVSPLSNHCNLRNRVGKLFGWVLNYMIDIQADWEGASFVWPFRLSKNFAIVSFCNLLNNVKAKTNTIWVYFCSSIKFAKAVEEQRHIWLLNTIACILYLDIELVSFVLYEYIDSPLQRKFYCIFNEIHQDLLYAAWVAHQTR